MPRRKEALQAVTTTSPEPSARLDRRRDRASWRPLTPRSFPLTHQEHTQP